MAKGIWSVLVLAVLLGGCASPPREALQAARTALARAHAAEAAKLAPEEYQSALEALRDGENLIRRKKYRLAEEILPFAESHAQRALLKAREEQVNRELQKVREQELLAKQAAEKKAQPKIPKPVPPKPPSEPTRQAITEARELRPKPKPAILPQIYLVRGGETLWTIAARRDIYSDSMLWPILYQSNRDQIKDPRQIYPGQKLTIPRNLSDAEILEARDKARRSKIFPIDVLRSETGPE
ncbi:MAG: LysM peptidoglycan-binding domain-containing protein [Syntrophotaleaceae bacterium]